MRTQQMAELTEWCQRTNVRTSEWPYFYAAVHASIYRHVQRSVH